MSTTNKLYSIIDIRAALDVVIESLEEMRKDNQNTMADHREEYGEDYMNADYEIYEKFDEVVMSAKCNCEDAWRELKEWEEE